MNEKPIGEDVTFNDLPESETVSEELKQCPFCEGKNIGTVNLGGLWRPACGKCGASAGLCKTEAKAITAWNHRPVVKESLTTASVSELKCKDCTFDPSEDVTCDRCRDGSKFTPVVEPDDPFGLNTRPASNPDCVAEAEAFEETWSAKIEIAKETKGLTWISLVKILTECIGDAKKHITALIAHCRGLEASETQLVGERDYRENQITDIYTALGGTDEWSNLHDLGDDSIGLIEEQSARIAELEAGCNKMADSYEAAIIASNAEIAELEKQVTKALSRTEPASPWIPVSKYFMWAITTISDVFAYNEYNDLNSDILGRIEAEIGFIEGQESAYTKENYAAFHLSLLELGVATLPTTNKAIDKYGETPIPPLPIQSKPYSDQICPDVNCNCSRKHIPVVMPYEKPIQRDEVVK